MKVTWALDVGDCRTVLAEMPSRSVDACVTDPPYELGFMGKTWDASGVAFQVETWRAIRRVLKPGAHLLAFGGTRTYHRMTCAIEDAGFEIRDSLHWFYGTGFPKSLNVGEGRGTALKPGHEPVVLARKPFKGTVAENVKRWGTGALNIDASRIKASESIGRWPANVLLDQDAAAELDTQARASRFFYVAKPSRAERDAGCEGLPERTGGEATDREDGSAGTRSPRAGAGRSGGARNFHPTVKPVALMRYLVRLVTPRGGTVLDPFCGSGTTGMAAIKASRHFLGVELSEEYAEIARARIAWAHKRRRRKR